jgi:hypothetical protein
MECMAIVATRTIKAAKAPFVAHELVGDAMMNSRSAMVLRRGRVEYVGVRGAVQMVGSSADIPLRGIEGFGDVYRELSNLSKE